MILDICLSTGVCGSCRELWVAERHRRQDNIAEPAPRAFSLSLKYAVSEQDISVQGRTGQPQHETPENVQGDSYPFC